jgi:hypothetical protein
MPEGRGFLASYGKQAGDRQKNEDQQDLGALLSDNIDGSARQKRSYPPASPCFADLASCTLSIAYEGNRSDVRITRSASSTLADSLEAGQPLGPG